jgi:lambda family phage portal protein
MSTSAIMPAVPSMRPPALARALRAVGFAGPARAWREDVLAEYGANLQRWYLDAAKNTTQTTDWKKIGDTPDLVHAADSRTARERAAYLVASTEYGHRAVEVLTDATVGIGIGTQMAVRWSKDERVNERNNADAEAVKLSWAETAGTGPTQHLYDLQTLWLRSTIADGQCLLYRRYLRNRKVRGLRGLKPAPALCYEVIPTSRLASYLAVPMPGGTIINGIEYDANGDPTAYHVQGEGYTYETFRLPAEHVLHHYRVDRPGQRQGMTWLAPVVQGLYMLRDIIEYKLIQYKVQSALSVLVSDEPPTGMGNVPGLPTPVGSTGTTAAGAKQQFLTPGMIHRVGAGRVTAFIPSPSADLDPLTRLCLRGIGVGFGISFERLSGNYDGLSFAGGRLVENTLKDRIDVVHSWYCRGVETQLHRDWIDYAQTMGDILTPPAKADPYACGFTRPRWRRGVNPVQEVQAAIQAIDAGLSSHRQEMAESGFDATAILEDESRLKSFAKADLQLAIAKGLDIEALPDPTAISESTANE